jgi:uncharacterized protein YbjT (DUF2867 family)
MNIEKQNVLIAGANGTTGRLIVDLLKNSDAYRPIAMLRKESQKEYFEKQDVATVIADLEGDLSHAVKDTHQVIFAAGSGGKKVIAVDQEGAKSLTDAAKKAGIKKFVMLSSMGADNPEAASDLQDYLKAKQNADKYLKDSGLDYSIVRPGALTDEDGTGKIQLQQKITTDGNIPRADVAKTLFAVLSNDIMKNQTFEILSGDVPVFESVVK